MTVTLSKPAQDLTWLVTGFAQRVPGVSYAMVASADGLPLTASVGLTSSEADRLAAVTSGLISVGTAIGGITGDEAVRQTVVEMGHSYYVAMTVQDGSILAVLAAGDSDLGAVGYEMARLAKQAGEILTPALRAELQRVLPMRERSAG